MISLKETLIRLTCPYRVNDLYITMSNIDPEVKWPWTEWEPYAEGRTLFGISTTDEDFAEVGQTGGTAGAWYHTHEDLGHTHSYSNRWADTSTGNTDVYDLVTGGTKQTTGAADYKTPNYNGSTNNQQSADIANMQPYVVTYIWRRTA